MFGHNVTESVARKAAAVPVAKHAGTIWSEASDKNVDAESAEEKRKDSGGEAN
jgi:hypothetical protein